MKSSLPIIYFIGAGPGAPDLITERGARLLSEASLVIYAGSLVSVEQLKRCQASCKLVDSAGLNLEEQVKLMAEEALNGGHVVRLHTGDPCLYGAIAEQIEKLSAYKVQIAIVPGVSSVFAAAASLQSELTYPGISQSLVLTRTPGRTPMPSGESAELFARSGATLAFYLSMGNVDNLYRDLSKGGLNDDTPIAIVYRASWPDEQILRGCLGNMVELVRESGIGRQAIILVGRALTASGNQSLLYHSQFSHGYRNHIGSESFSGKCAIYAYTDKALERAKELLPILDAEIYTTRSIDEGLATIHHIKPGTHDSLLAKNWELYDAQIFISATGIAVRKIAPFLVDKTVDPAVVVCNETGEFVISLTSGHLGGANRLSRRIARLTGGKAIISTATDLADIPAFDEIASLKKAKIQNPELIKVLNGALLHHEPILLDAPQHIGSIWADIPNVRIGNIESKTENEKAVLWIPSNKPIDLSSIPDNTLIIQSQEIILGIGCKRNTPLAEIEYHIQDFLSAHDLHIGDIKCLASCSLKTDEPGLLAFSKQYGLSLETYDIEDLKTISVPTPSSIVEEKIGTPSVCEAAAIQCSGGKIIVPKHSSHGITLALAQKEVSRNTNHTHPQVTIVGLGSGSLDCVTPEVMQALKSCDVVAGYRKYVDFIRSHVSHKPLIESGMMGEVERCMRAMQSALEGNHVCMVCSGDPGILAMAGLMFELKSHHPQFSSIDIQVLPGITAANIAASSLGAPLQNGYSLISLSDLLVPSEEVKANLASAAQGYLPVALYNPAGKKRRTLMEWAINHFIEKRGEETLSAIVKHAGRPQEEKWIGRLKDFPFDQVDMSSLIIIGGHRTKQLGDNLYEARGYEDKYQIQTP